MSLKLPVKHHVLSTIKDMTSTIADMQICATRKIPGIFGSFQANLLVFQKVILCVCVLFFTVGQNITNEICCGPSVTNLFPIFSKKVFFLFIFEPSNYTFPQVVHILTALVPESTQHFLTEFNFRQGQFMFREKSLLLNFEYLTSLCNLPICSVYVFCLLSG